jgi:hypothetical protein
VAVVVALRQMLLKKVTKHHPMQIQAMMAKMAVEVLKAQKL